MHGVTQFGTFGYNFFIASKKLCKKVTIPPVIIYMKTIPLFCAVLLSLLSSPISRSQESTSPNTNSDFEATYPRFLDKSGMQIITATYGSGTAFSDVTNETTKLLNQQSRFYARPEWLRADPTPGWNKALVIIFTYQGRRYIFSCGEGGEVRIPLLKQVAAEQDAAANP